MNSCNVYEKLYENTKAKFTIFNNNCEYTLGDYMLMKAGKKKNSSNLPATKTVANTQKAVTAFFSYVNEKLTVKKPPVKDKIIRRFPFMTSATAFLSAMIVCGLVLSFGLFSAKDITSPSPMTAVETSETDENNAFDYCEK